MKLIPAIILLSTFILTSCEPIPTTPTIYQTTEVFNVGKNAFVRSLAIDKRKGSLWVGTALGVHQVDYQSGELKTTFTREHGLANEYVFAINVDDQGNKWFGTNAGGMSRYNDGQWKTFFPMHGLADYWVYSFANHPDGSLWVGTWAGVNRVDRETLKFETYVKELVNEWVYGIDISDDGVIWFGTEGGVTRYDGKQWQSWTHNEGLGASNGEQLPYSVNTGLGTRSRHDLGIFSGGKATYNPSYVFSIKIDQRDQTIWAGTWGGGVAHFVDNKWHNLTVEQGLAGNIVYSILQASDGAMWFGTSGGLSRFDGENWQTFTTNSGLLDNHIYALAQSPDGTIWAGSRQGVTRLSPQAPL